MLRGLIAIPARIGLAVPLMTSVLLASAPPGRAGWRLACSIRCGGLAAILALHLVGSLLAAAGMEGIRAAFTSFAALLIAAAVLASLGLSMETG